MSLRTGFLTMIVLISILGTGLVVAARLNHASLNSFTLGSYESNRLLLKAGRAYRLPLPQPVHLSIPDEPVFEPSIPRQNFQGIVQDFNTKVAARITPGWLHLQTLSTADYEIENFGFLDNGTPIPLNSITDDWLHINDQGLVTELVSQMLTQTGEVVQVGVYQNGQSRNLTISGEPFELEPFVPQWDYGFSGSLNLAQKNRDNIAISAVNIDGQSITMISIFSKDIGIAASIPSLDKPYLTGGLRAYFNTLTGQFIKQETIYKFEDGTERVTQLIRPLVFEPVAAPPQFVLDYLSQPLGQ